jgi:dienelactone hydrolase
VHGSGPHDRDETIGPNKPLRDLAWGLASQGVAVLRYEKRTKEHSKKLVDIKDTLTLKEEVIDDAMLAVTALRKESAIDGKRIFVLGHSLGAVAAPKIGERDSALAGLILMAGNTRPLEDVILDQVTYIASLPDSGMDKEELAKIKKQVEKVKDRQLTKDTPAAELPLGVSAAYWLGLREYDQAATAARLKQPLLLLQGERDYQVTVADFDGWKKALAAKKNADFKSYSRLNHLFMEGEGKAKPDEYNKAGHVSREVVDDIARWINKH